jgi:hypothetical protein
MTRAASAVAFRLLLAAVAAAVLYFDMTLAFARATPRLPVKAASDCSASPASPAAPNQAPVAPAVAGTAAAAPSVPPGFEAAFGSCGETAAPTRKDR